ncbi:uncharacterized protein LOC125811846 [Solanum verrucosum]|uniref:uncharacterized protein LOC125811846 n=1 Tax=Solanum verrucosum TaxID=315347 RepID=UPI0020D07E76|nr:uncharacterized protein LOC125811846 [Solanum verrucosum]
MTTQDMTTQANREVVVPLNPYVGTTTTRIRDFTRMNPSKFHDFMVEKDPQEFIDEVYKMLMIMGVMPVEKAELAAYQLKGVCSSFVPPMEGREGGFSNAPPKFNKDWVSNPKPQGGNGSESSFPTCAKCGKKHDGRCLAGSNACFGCGKMGHNIRDCPSVSKNEEDNHRLAQPNPSSGSSGSQKQNGFYALQTRCKQEGSLDVVIGTLKVFILILLFA